VQSTDNAFAPLQAAKNKQFRCPRDSPLARLSGRLYPQAPLVILWRRSFKMLMPFARTPFVHIEYEEHGSLDHRPLILLHGFPDSFRTWDGVIENLKGERLRILVPHLRGFGGTRVHNLEALSGQTAALAQDVLDFADTLGVDRFVLVGHDWGARTAYSVAVLAPQRLLGLVTLSTPYLMFRGKRESPEQIRAYWYQWYFNTERGREAFAVEPIPFCEYLWPSWSPEWKYTQAELESAKFAWTNPQFVPIVISYYRHRYGNAPGAPAYVEQQSRLDSKSGGPPPQVEIPLLFGCGLEDAVNLPASSQGQGLWFPRGYERIDFPNVGHFPQREVPDAVTQLILRALSAK
jgi:pimeloyl-ACP methyl ester carboxylesterase